MSGRQSSLLVNKMYLLIKTVLRYEVARIFFSPARRGIPAVISHCCAVRPLKQYGY